LSTGLPEIFELSARISRVNQRSRLDWLLLAGFCGFLFFFGLSFFGLIGADEPRYAQVAREMLARHDWITPVLNGAPWLEKPPLYYWQAMLAYTVFGVSDWAARLPSALDATLMIIAVYLFLQRFRSGVHIDGALMTASAAGIVGFARAAATDMPLAATFTIALLGWYAWYETGATRYLCSFYVFLALATLAKGPVALFLAGAILVIFALIRGEMLVVRRTLWSPAALLFFLFALPWYLAVQMRNPQFFRVFIVEHNLARFGTNLYHHKEPFWYFIPVALLGLLPWVVFAIAGLIESGRDWWKERSITLNSEHALTLFLTIWLLFPVIFFSLSQSKLPGYILPAVPAGTLLALEALRRREKERTQLWTSLGVLHAVIAAALVVPALMIQYLVLQHRMPWGQGLAISAGFAAVIAIGITVTLRQRSGLAILRFVTLVPVVLAVAAVLRLGSPALDSTLSARPLANEIGRMETKRMGLAVFRVKREVEYGLAFYRDQPVERYELGQIPNDEHLLVAPEGTQVEIAKQVPGRRVSYLGSFGPQGLDYYWVGKVTK
jgi:4-amino-4-deoxy-L-arabinose transferase-like glycosyltransferase